MGKLKAEELLAKLSRDEKIALVTGKDNWTTRSFPAKGLEPLILSDGPHGVRKAKHSDDSGMEKDSRELATCFPTASALASSWDTALAEEVARAIASECLEMGVHILLGPGINMKRSPLCGRNFEYYSEDPILSAEMASAFVKGLQSQGVGACVKHFACNNQETKRFTVSSEVDERALHEIYLKPFRLILEKQPPWAMMCAYNKVNGVPMAHNEFLLKELLREEYGFKGLLMSDWGAVSDRAASLKATLDLAMPGPAPGYSDELRTALDSGAVNEKVLNDSVHRIIETSLKLTGMHREKTALDFRKHHLLARKAAASSLVLLKNRNNLLPLEVKNANNRLSLSSKQEIVLLTCMGPLAKNAPIQGKGSSEVSPRFLDNPYDEIKKEGARHSIRVDYAPGYKSDGREDNALLSQAVSRARASDALLIFTGPLPHEEAEGQDRKNISLNPSQVRLIREVSAVNDNVIVLLTAGSAVSTAEWEEGVSSILLGHLAGQGAGKAFSDVLFGLVNPSGKLTETFPVSLAQNPSALNFPGENGKVRYAEGIFTGYRYYQSARQKPSYPFGHGLSYTKFIYTKLVIEKNRLEPEDILRFSFDVTNTGHREGFEVVQVYYRDNESALLRPDRELAGFRKVFIKPGETQKVTFSFEKEAFAYYYPASGGFITEEGAFTLLIGSSSEDIRLTGEIFWKTGEKAYPLLTPDTYIKDLLKDRKAKRVFKHSMGILWFILIHFFKATFVWEVLNMTVRKIRGMILSPRKHNKLMRKLERIERGRRK